MKTKTQNIVLAALFAAITCVATMLIRLPSPKGYINLGDSIVLLAGWTMSPLYGFMAAAVGSAIADILLGFTAYAPVTFVIKGVMALTAWLFKEKLFGKKGSRIFGIIGGCCAEIIMVLGYLIFESFLYGGEGGFAAATVSVPFNSIQGAVGLVVALILDKLFEKAKIIG